jgi:aspartate carbamoyltransferase catalytic subunit
MEKLYHLTKAEQLTTSIVADLLKDAEGFNKSLKAGVRNFKNLSGVTICSLFYEESTRTRFSFERAALLLGATVIGTENAAKFSSAAKGESLEHTIKMVSGAAKGHLGYADIIVLRHPENDAADRAARVSSVPIINAGSGADEHPTQALLDAYTFQKLLGRLDHFTISFIGDLKFSRVVNSDAFLLSQYPGVKMFFVAPEGLEVRPDLKSHLSQKGVKFEEASDIKEVVQDSDICYVVRVQKNRIKDSELLLAYQRNKNNFAVTEEVYKMSQQKGTFFCHPMPVDEEEQEIRPEVENLPRVKMFEQAGYGVPVRMAILAKVWQNTKI